MEVSVEYFRKLPRSPWRCSGVPPGRSRGCAGGTRCLSAGARSERDNNLPRDRLSKPCHERRRNKRDKFVFCHGIASVPAGIPRWPQPVPGCRCPKSRTAATASTCRAGCPTSRRGRQPIFLPTGAKWVPQDGSRGRARAAVCHAVTPLNGDCYRPGDPYGGGLLNFTRAACRIIQYRPKFALTYTIDPESRSVTSQR